MMIPEDLDDAQAMADFARCMTMPREFARMAEHLGMTVAELRRHRDRALEQSRSRKSINCAWSSETTHTRPTIA
jgi:hypothetical protein